MNLCIFEDAFSVDMHPLTYTRPVFELRCGILQIREKLAVGIPHHTLSLFVRSFLQRSLKASYPNASVNQLEPEDTFFINARVIPDQSIPLPSRKNETNARLYVQNGDILGAYLPADRVLTILDYTEDGIIQWEKLPTEFHTSEVAWSTVRYPWDVIKRNGEEISADIQRLTLKPNFNPDHYPFVYAKNTSEIYLGEKVQLKPGVVLDADNGPIFLDDEVIVKPNAVIAGPCFVGKKSEISAGSNITGKCSFGPVCKIGGEVGQTIIQGYTNKKHDGFLGGAYLGEWVNIGAGTNNSDLKNNYSTVKVAINGTIIDTNSQFVGCLIGDHTKVGIGSTINTGTVIGTGCNIFGSGFPKKYVPAFSWGNGAHLGEHRLDKMLETARTAMERRSIQLTESYEVLLRSVFQQTAAERADTHSKA